jgi:hypothetical protein
VFFVLFVVKPMNLSKFFEAANHLSIWTDALYNRTSMNLRQAEDLLCHPRAEHPDLPPREFVLAQLIDSIGEAIEEVMCAHDLLSRAAGLPESFNEAL